MRMGRKTPTDASMVSFFRSDSFLIAPRNILRTSIHRDPKESCHHSHPNCKKLSSLGAGGPSWYLLRASIDKGCCIGAEVTEEQRINVAGLMGATTCRAHLDNPQ